MDILSKLKGVLSESDLVLFEQAVKVMIDERAAIKADQMKSILKEETDKFITEEVAKKLVVEKENLIKEYDEKLASFETLVTEKFDAFLDSEIAQNITEASIEKIALNETYKPIVEDIVKLFEEKYVALDVEGFGILKEAKKEIEKLENIVSTTIAEKMTIQESLDDVKAKLLVVEKTEGMNLDQKKKVNSLVEGKSFAEVATKIDSVIDIIMEQTEVKTEKKVVTEAHETQDTVLTEETTKAKVIDPDKNVHKTANAFL